MFAKTIVDSDAFLDMPLSTQALYFHLSMRADDDGFTNNPKKVMRMIGAGQNELELLLDKRFLICFENGVVVIKHWKIHNYIRSDRYKPTVHIEELNKLTTKDNKAYTEIKLNGDDSEIQLEIYDIPKIEEPPTPPTPPTPPPKEKVKKTDEVVEAINEYTENKKLIEALKEFRKMRVKMKKPPTARAMKGIFKHLDTFSKGDDEVKIQLIDQSILHNWQDIYELKNAQNNKAATVKKSDTTTNKFHGFDQRDTKSNDELEKILGIKG